MKIIKYNSIIHIDSSFDYVMSQLRVLEQSDSLLIGKYKRLVMKLNKEKNGFLLTLIRLPLLIKEPSVWENANVDVVECGDHVEVNICADCDGVSVSVFVVLAIGFCITIAMWLNGSAVYIPIVFMLFWKPFYMMVIFVAGKVEFNRMEHHIVQALKTELVE